MTEPVHDYTCRRCAGCSKASHHWLEGFDEDDDGEFVDHDDPRWLCKHCEFSMPYGYGDMDTEKPEAMYRARRRDGWILRHDKVHGVVQMTDGTHVYWQDGARVRWALIEKLDNGVGGIRTHGAKRSLSEAVQDAHRELQARREAK